MHALPVSVGTNAATTRINEFCMAPRPRHPNHTPQGRQSFGIDEGFELRAATRGRGEKYQTHSSVFSLKFSFSLISRHSTSRLELISPLYTQAHTLIPVLAFGPARTRAALSVLNATYEPLVSARHGARALHVSHTPRLARDSCEPRRASICAPRALHPPCPIRRSMSDTALGARYGAASSCSRATRPRRRPPHPNHDEKKLFVSVTMLMGT